jgi:hypothetical protein
MMPCHAATIRNGRRKQEREKKLAGLPKTFPAIARMLVIGLIK